MDGGCSVHERVDIYHYKSCQFYMCVDKVGMASTLLHTYISVSTNTFGTFT